MNNEQQNYRHIARQNGERRIARFDGLLQRSHRIQDKLSTIVCLPPGAIESYQVYRHDGYIHVAPGDQRAQLTNHRIVRPTLRGFAAESAGDIRDSHSTDLYVLCLLSGKPDFINPFLAIPNYFPKKDTLPCP